MAKAKIAKHQVVLSRELASEMFTRYADPDDPARMITLPDQICKDLGKPATITVTVEPGRKL